MVEEEGSVCAFVPGHVTGFFSSHPAEDPERAGSRGAGVTLTDGVSVEVVPAQEVETRLNGTPISIPPVERVLDALSIPARVVATTDLPLGAGFGVSGAMALGTALAANEAFDRRLSEDDLVTIAHSAEVESGTGLGDVVAQARGGVPIRLEPGAPAYNRLDGVPTGTRIEYLTFGELSTESVLSGDTERLTEAGLESLSMLVEEPTLSTFAYASRRFAREADLLTDRVQEVIEDVSDGGGEASMAMLGHTVFALGTGLSDAGYDPAICRTHAAGASLLVEEPEPTSPSPHSYPPRVNNAGDL
jgi:pantoate kinase